ncbi:hypothetical protein [Pseudomonas japonica]|uniref:hypothetical protein n=1 Tax=Pseudomonas japonica TaxID=256466 RepID=UPI0015E398B3|nr:hypothetical protein [Pseudomonas japonica]MBA1242976.1 hypothetical protein [Pseudomonas japonica]MBA1287545.1 hypothetical protein [Pseudomonas japonica]
MSPSNAQLEQLDRELDENQRELIILPMDGPVTRIPPFTTVPTPTQVPQICTRTQPGLLDGAWGRTQAAYDGTVHKYLAKPWPVPVALGIYDAYNVGRLLRDINGFGTKVRVSTHNGRLYLILTGYPGLRNKLKGTRYGIRNPQLIEMGIGKYGIRGSSIAGFKLSCYVAVGIEVLEWVFNDEAVMSDLFAGIGVELVKAGIASAVGYAAALVAGLYIGAAATPLIIGAGLVLAIGIGLNILDNEYKIKDTTKAALRHAIENIQDLQATFIKVHPSNVKPDIENKAANLAANLANGLYEEAKRWALRKIDGEIIAPWPSAPRLPNFPALKLPGL